MGYVFLALENGRFVFPVERRASADLEIYRVPDPPIFLFRLQPAQWGERFNFTQLVWLPTSSLA
jgi:hypothetical protein